MAETAKASLPRPVPLLLAAALALANAAWSIFLWQQLHVARTGGDPYCALGGGCASLWDGAFASAIQAWTLLPVAAWGLAWSGAGLALALLAWQRGRSGREAVAASGGLAWLALAGVLGVSVLIGVSARAGELSGSCAVTYALIGGFAGCVFVALPDLGASLWQRGVVSAGLAVAASALALVYPALQTPPAGASLGTDLLPPDAELAQSEPLDPFAQLERLLAELPPRERQHFANARAAYLDAEPVETRRARSVIGARMAPVRVTSWTDSGCSHCGTFHQAMERVLRAVPPSSIAIEQRVFPLDRSCNPNVTASGNEAVCLAARVRLCLEEHEGAWELAGWLHREAQPLGVESIYGVATRLGSRPALESCVASRTTAQKLADDITFAREAGLRGTPYILVNGRPTQAYAPFLYALAVTQGDAEHPLFDSLPPPSEELGHEGHDH